MLINIEAVLLALMIILAIVTVKKSKLFKLRYLIIIEVVLLGISSLIGYILFNLVRDNIETNIQSNMQDAINSVVNYNKEADYSADLNSIALSGFVSGIDEDDLEDMYLRLETYDSDHQQTYDSYASSNVLFMYTYYLPDDTQEETKVFNLDDYFSKEEINSLRDYYNSDTHSGTTDVAVKGYYDSNDQFIPTALVLTDYNNDYDHPYEVGHANKDDIILRDVSLLGEDPSGDYSYSNNLCLLNTSDRTAKRALENTFTIDETVIYDSDPWGYQSKIFKNDHGIYYSILDQENEDRIVILNMYADTTDMTLKDTFFRIYLLSIVVILHAVVTMTLAVFSIYINNKRKLDQSRDTFINAMAHEMKTPVAVIQNCSEILKEGLYPEKKEHYLDMNQEEAIHLNHLLTQMLTYTRTNESYQLKLESVNLLDLVNSTLKHYEIKQHLTIEIPEDTTIQCDSSLMSVVIDNFISNAIKYSDQEISIQYQDQKFTIYNSGSQISKEDLKKIWEPLYKADSSRNDTNSTGMGLAISANILQLHHFKYGCNQLEHGVEFYFTAK